MEPIRLTENLVLQKTRVDNLKHVKNLNLWGSDLCDVSILREMPNVEVLSLSVNKIQGLRDFSGCAKLRELYLRKNEISELSEVRYLDSLPHLRILWLCDNPCAEVAGYRQYVLRTLPRLEKLDDVDVTPSERTAASKLSDQDCRAIVQQQPQPRQLPPQLPPPSLMQQQQQPPGNTPGSGKPQSVPRKKAGNPSSEPPEEDSAFSEKPKGVAGNMNNRPLPSSNAPPGRPAGVIPPEGISQDEVSGNIRRKWSTDATERPSYAPHSAEAALAEQELYVAHQMGARAAAAAAAAGGATGQYYAPPPSQPQPRLQPPPPPPPQQLGQPPPPLIPKQREPLPLPPSGSHESGGGGYMVDAAGGGIQRPVVASKPKVRASGSGSGGSHRSLSSQKNILTAMLSLLNELNTEGLEIIHQEVSERLGLPANVAGGGKE